MEEILASIRRIIADDDPGKPGGKAAPEPAPAPAAPKPAAPTVTAGPRPAPPSPPRVAPVPPPPAAKQEEVDAATAPEPPKPAPRPAASPPASVPPADVLDLTEQMAAPSFRTIDASSDVVFAERSPERVEPLRPAPVPIEPGLMSAATRAAVDGAFNSLANTVLGNNARTLEDLVKEMLRPMLKSWLDDNLPGMVERIVRAEIERVSRGR